MTFFFFLGSCSIIEQTADIILTPIDTLSIWSEHWFKILTDLPSCSKTTLKLKKLFGKAQGTLREVNLFM